MNHTIRQFDYILAFHGITLRRRKDKILFLQRMCYVLLSFFCPTPDLIDLSVYEAFPPMSDFIRFHRDRSYRASLHLSSLFPSGFCIEMTAPRM